MVIGAFLSPITNKSLEFSLVVVCSEFEISWFFTSLPLLNTISTKPAINNTDARMVKNILYEFFIEVTVDALNFKQQLKLSYQIPADIYSVFIILIFQIFCVLSLRQSLVLWLIWTLYNSWIVRLLQLYLPFLQELVL